MTRAKGHGSRITHGKLWTKSKFTSNLLPFTMISMSSRRNDNNSELDGFLVCNQQKLHALFEKQVCVQQDLQFFSTLCNLLLVLRNLLRRYHCTDPSQIVFQVLKLSRTNLKLSRNSCQATTSKLFLPTFLRELHRPEKLLPLS